MFVSLFREGDESWGKLRDGVEGFEECLAGGRGGSGGEKVGRCMYMHVHVEEIERSTCTMYVAYYTELERHVTH